MTNQISVPPMLMNLKAERGTTIGNYIAAMQSLVNRVSSLRIAIEEPMQVAILLVSLGNLPEYRGAVGSIKTLNPRAATWAIVATRIIEEQK